MKHLFKLKQLVIVLAIIGLLSSCEDDENSKPVITLNEVGLNNSHIAYAGSDLHIDAEIIAEALIEKIVVEIHAEEAMDEEYEFVFTEDAGLKNTHFHKHVDIPETASLGDYHFHLKVIDKEGNSTSEELEIEVKELADEEAPVFNITSQPSSSDVFNNGEAITFEGSVSDNNFLAGMFVALVYEDDAIADADVNGANAKVIPVEHTHDFDSEKTDNFNLSITVGQAMDQNMTPKAIEGDNAWKSGKYYILARCKDAKDNWVFHKGETFTINL